MRRALIMIVVLGFIAGAALTSLLAHRRASSQQTVLPNGMRVEWLGTTVGDATFNTERPWQNWVRKNLPMAVTRRIVPALGVSGSCSSSSNSITVFVRVSDPSGASITTVPWSGYGAEDDLGFRYNRDGGYCSFGGGPGRVYGLSLSAHPRHQKDFLFHFFDANDAVLGTLRVPNPVRGPFPKWMPASLPQIRTNGPVTLTLNSIKEGNPWRSMNPGWKLAAANPQWSRARPRYWTLLDATGNEAQWLSPREPAWKVRTFVFREQPEDFSAEEQVIITNLVPPGPAQFVSLDRTSNIGGIKLVAHVLCGAGHIHITNWASRAMTPPTGSDRGHSMSTSGQTTVHTWGDSNPFFLIEARDVQSQDEIRFRLRDDRHQPIELSETSSYSGLNGGGRMYVPSFSPTNATNPLSLEITVNRPLRFDFMVNPADLRTK